MVSCIDIVEQWCPAQTSWTSLVIQWLRLCAPNAGNPDSIPGQGTRSCLPQLKIPCPA